MRGCKEHYQRKVGALYNYNQPLIQISNHQVCSLMQEDFAEEK